MSAMRSLLAGALAIGVIALQPSTGHCQQQTLWYRGYFDGQVTIKDGPTAGYYYSPSRPTAYPLYEAERFSEYLPCSACGCYHRPGAYVPQLGRVCNGNGAHLDPDIVYTPAPYRLPGQYYYEKQNHYTFSIPITVGWPYMKYDQPTEPTGTIHVGRSIGRTARHQR